MFKTKSCPQRNCILVEYVRQTIKYVNNTMYKYLVLQVTNLKEKNESSKELVNDR